MRNMEATPSQKSATFKEPVTTPSLKPLWKAKKLVNTKELHEDDEEEHGDAKDEDNEHDSANHKHGRPDERTHVNTPARQ